MSISNTKWQLIPKTCKSYFTLFEPSNDPNDHRNCVRITRMEKTDLFSLKKCDARFVDKAKTQCEQP